MSNHKWRFFLGMIGLYLCLQVIASRLTQPVLSPQEPGTREPFPVDFVLPSLHREEVRLSSQRGKVVLVNLWATWCSPCRAEIPSLQALYKDYHARGLVILAIAIDPDGEAVVAPFVHEYQVNFPVLVDPRNTLGGRLQVPGIPISYLLDQEGRIVNVEMGARDWNASKVRQFLDLLLAEQPYVSPALVGEK